MTAPYEYNLKRDRNGRIVEKTETVAGRSMVWTCGYDTAGRLVKARLDGRRVCQCWYDRQGRRIQDCFPLTAGRDLRRFTYRLDDRLQSAGNNGYTHDGNGFRSIWNNWGRYTTYAYSPDYRLLRAEKEDEGTVFEFAHDEDGRRVAKYRNGDLAEAYAWHDFIRLAGFHDGEQGFEFAYREDERTPYAMRREDGFISYLFCDQVGSLRVVADTDGNVIKEILYDPFGGIIEDTNPALRIPIGFAGGLHDRDLGFVRFGWRDYDPFTSRWTAPDPMGDAGGDDDWYAYCLDDPVNGEDPLGLWKNEYGETIPEGRVITEYAPGIESIFSAYGAKRKIQTALRKEKAEYTDSNDWAMRSNLEKEAEDFGLLDGFWSTYRHKTDRNTIQYYIQKAKEKIGNR